MKATSGLTILPKSNGSSTRNLLTMPLSSIEETVYQSLTDQSPLILKAFMSLFKPPSRLKSEKSKPELIKGSFLIAVFLVKIRRPISFIKQD